MAAGDYHKDRIVNRRVHPETLMMGYGYARGLSEGALKPPIFLTSTFVFESAQQGKDFFDLTSGPVAGHLPAERRLRAVPDDTSQVWCRLIWSWTSKDKMCFSRRQGEEICRRRRPGHGFQHRLPAQMARPRVV